MTKHYTSKAASKINFGHYAISFYRQVKPIAHRGFVEKVAKDGITFDPLDIVYQGPLALFKSMVPFVVNGAKAIYKTHQRKKRFNHHAHWIPVQPVHTTTATQSTFFSNASTTLQKPKTVTSRRKQQQAIKRVLRT